MVIPGLALLGAGCASSQEWDVWSKNSAHFASGDHMFFSLRNQGEAAKKVTRADVETARTQTWWGRAVTVDSSAILQQ
jgi:hypothetical protein